MKELLKSFWESIKQASKESFKQAKACLLAFVKTIYECLVNLLKSLHTMTLSLLEALDEMLAEGVTKVVKTIYEKIIKNISKW